MQSKMMFEEDEDGEHLMNASTLGHSDGEAAQSTPAAERRTADALKASAANARIRESMTPAAELAGASPIPPSPGPALGKAPAPDSNTTRAQRRSRRSNVTSTSSPAAGSEESEEELPPKHQRGAWRYPGLHSTTSYRQLGTVGACHQYTISGWQLAASLGCGARLTSDAWVAAGQLFRLEVYPAGCAADARRSVSVFLTTAGGGAAPNHVIHEVALLDQSGGGRHIVRACRPQDGPLFAAACGVVAGYPEFCKAALLQRHARRYLVNDTLVLRATVEVVRSWSATPQGALQQGALLPTGSPLVAPTVTSLAAQQQQVQEQWTQQQQHPPVQQQRPRHQPVLLHQRQPYPPQPMCCPLCQPGAAQTGASMPECHSQPQLHPGPQLHHAPGADCHSSLHYQPLAGRPRSVAVQHLPSFPDRVAWSQGQAAQGAGMLWPQDRVAWSQGPAAQGAGCTLYPQDRAAACHSEEQAPGVAPSSARQRMALPLGMLSASAGHGGAVGATPGYWQAGCACCCCPASGMGPTRNTCGPPSAYIALYSPTASDCYLHSTASAPLAPYHPTHVLMTP